MIFRRSVVLPYLFHRTDRPSQCVSLCSYLSVPPLPIFTDGSPSIKSSTAMVSRCTFFRSPKELWAAFFFSIPKPYFLLWMQIRQFITIYTGWGYWHLFAEAEWSLTVRNLFISPIFDHRILNKKANFIIFFDNRNDSNLSNLSPDSVFEIYKWITTLQSLLTAKVIIENGIEKLYDQLCPRLLSLICILLLSTSTPVT